MVCEKLDFAAVATVTTLVVFAFIPSIFWIHSGANLVKPARNLEERSGAVM